MGSPLSVVRQRDTGDIYKNRRRAAGLGTVLAIGVLAAGPAHKLTETVADAGADGGAAVARHVGLGLGSDFTASGSGGESAPEAPTITTRTVTLPGTPKEGDPVPNAPSGMVPVADQVKAWSK